MQPYSKRKSDSRQPGAKRKIIKWWFNSLIKVAELLLQKELIFKEDIENIFPARLFKQVGF